MIDLEHRDRESFEELLASHRMYLLQLIDIRMSDELRSRVDPSDIVQDAQIEAFRRASEFASDCSMPFRLWVRQIAIDRLIMAHRQHVQAVGRSVRREIAIRDNSSIAVAKQLVAHFASPSVQVLQDELVHTVQTAIGRLGEQDREIVLLQAFEKLSSSECAMVLGIEPPAVRKRFGRALMRLKKLLIETGLGGSEHERQSN